LLVPAMQSTAAVIRVIEALKKEFVTVMFLLSARRLDQLMLNDALLLS
jgi:isopentenyl diphosphate isomerase/L-lactate dehydrogenase-like FMN-dependent dehydrogenase